MKLRSLLYYLRALKKIINPHHGSGEGFRSAVGVWL